MKIVFLAHLFSSLFMNRVIWAAQAVHHTLQGPYYHNLLVKEFNLFIFIKLAAFMRSAPGSIWTGWERRRSLYTSRIWQRTTRIDKYSRRRRRFAYTLIQR